MGALKHILVSAALLHACRTEAHDVERWRAHIAQASARFGVPQAWIARVIDAESGGRTSLAGRPITSRAGAMGLMQLMPATWSEMRARHGLGTDPHDPRDNILAGTAYLREMYDRFGYPGLFAAYNAGPGRFARHLATGRPLPAETIAYLAAVAREATPVSAGQEGPAARSIFAVRAGAASLRGVPGTSSVLPGPAGPGLFVPLRHAGAGRDTSGKRGGGAIAGKQ